MLTLSLSLSLSLSTCSLPSYSLRVAHPVLCVHVCVYLSLPLSLWLNLLVTLFTLCLVISSPGPRTINETMQSKSIFLFLATLLTFGLVAMAHECYVCNNQGDNREKCVKTVKTCAIDETSCMSTVRWGSTPYWDPMGQKQYYISKRCARRDECEMERARNTRCDRIWYNDWECVECCFGDRCNYYITLGSNSISPMRALLTLVSALSIFIAHRGLSLG